MKVEILDVTPNMAKIFLMNNDSNRKINKAQLDMLERSINGGSWRLTHQGIAFYVDGSLADGQHRLNAVINTGHTLKMAVFTGVERDIDTVMAIDCGKGRSVKDGAKISGFDLKYSELSVARGLEYGYEETFRGRLTHIEQYDLCKKWGSEIELAGEMFRKRVKGITIAAVKVAAINAAKDGADLNIVRAFCETLVTGEYIAPIYTNAVKVRNKLMTEVCRNTTEQIIAYNVTYNAIFRTVKGEKMIKVNTSQFR